MAGWSSCCTSKSHVKTIRSLLYEWICDVAGEIYVDDHVSKHVHIQRTILLIERLSHICKETKKIQLLGAVCFYIVRPMFNNNTPEFLVYLTDDSYTVEQFNEMLKLCKRKPVKWVPCMFLSYLNKKLFELSTTMLIESLSSFPYNPCRMASEATKQWKQENKNFSRSPKLQKISKFYEINENDFLGEGTFGKVFKAKNKRTGVECAVKILSTDEYDQCRREFELVKKIQNKAGLVKYHKLCYGYDFYASDFPCTKVFLVMDLVNGKPLDKLHRSFDEQGLVDVVKNWIRAIEKIHKLGVVHKDNKSSNIIVNPLTKEVRLIDYGSMTCNEMKMEHHDDFTGTYVFVHPRVYVRINDENRSEIPLEDWKKCDLWAIGQSIYWMLFGGTTSGICQKTENISKIKKCLKEKPQTWKKISSENYPKLAPLLNKLLDVKRTPTFEELLQ